MNNEEGKEVLVQLSQSTFSDMVLNFLGKKEKLTYHVKYESFIIRLNDLEQFYFLLNNKIKKEQNIVLEHFLVNISYNDKTKREIIGINALNSFIETRDVLPIDVTLTWNIVVKYPTSESIENQIIELSFIKNSVKDEVILNIYHTNQAWGIEVLNLFRDKIGELIQRQSKQYNRSNNINYFLFDRFIYNFYPLILTFLVLFSISHADFENNNYYETLVYYTNTKDTTEKEIIDFSIKHLDAAHIDKLISEQVELPDLKKVLQKISDSKKNEKFDILISLAFNLFSIATPIYFLYIYVKKAISFYFVPSFIILNRRSENEYNYFSTGKNKTEFYSISMILFTIGTGIFVNYIFQLIF